MCSPGGIGGILGGLAGTGLSIFAPELGIPLFLASGLGSGIGTTVGDVASGKPFGTSLEQGAISGGISGALAGAGNVAAGGDFFGAPASSITGVFSGAPTAAADTLAGSTTAATTGAAVPASLASAAPAAATNVAPAVGVGGGGATLGGDITGIGGAVGSAPASIGGAVGAGGVPIAGPAGAVGPSGPAGATSLLPSDFGGGGDFPGATFANATTTGGGAATGPYGITNPAFTDTNINAAWNKAATAGDGGWFSNLFKAQPGGSFLSKGLAGEPGSLAADLTKPSTLITGGAALLPLMQGNTIPGLSGIQNQAQTYNAMGTPLAQALQTGNLPAGAQSSLDAQTRAATAAVRSRFAQMGLSGSSQEADALGQVQANEASQKVKMLGDITSIGISEMGRADQLLQNIMTTQLAQDREQQAAIARLAAALAGSTGQEKTTA